MKNGVVLAYSNDVSAGVIRARDGKRIFFTRKNWKSAIPPCTGQAIVFSNDASGNLQVYFESDARTKIAV